MGIKTTYTLHFDAIPEYYSNERKPDGYGERLVERYRYLVLLNVYNSTNKNIEETARIMGWSVYRTKDLLT